MKTKKIISSRSFGYPGNTVDSLDLWDLLRNDQRCSLYQLWALCVTLCYVKPGLNNEHMERILGMKLGRYFEINGLLTQHESRQYYKPDIRRTDLVFRQVLNPFKLIEFFSLLGVFFVKWLTLQGHKDDPDQTFGRSVGFFRAIPRLVIVAPLLVVLMLVRAVTSPTQKILQPLLQCLLHSWTSRVMFASILFTALFCMSLVVIFTLGVHFGIPSSMVVLGLLAAKLAAAWHIPLLAAQIGTAVVASYLAFSVTVAAMLSLPDLLVEFYYELKGNPRSCASLEIIENQTRSIRFTPSRAPSRSGELLSGDLDGNKLDKTSVSAAELKKELQLLIRGEKPTKTNTDSKVAVQKNAYFASNTLSVWIHGVPAGIGKTPEKINAEPWHRNLIKVVSLDNLWSYNPKPKVQKAEYQPPPAITELSRGNNSDDEGSLIRRETQPKSCSSAKSSPEPTVTARHQRSASVDLSQKLSHEFMSTLTCKSSKMLALQTSFPVSRENSRTSLLPRTSSLSQLTDLFKVQRKEQPINRRSDQVPALAGTDMTM